MGGDTVLARRRGNSYELATVLVSWLLGAGYGALVVNGRANRELTRAYREHLSCPHIPDQTKHEEVSDEVPEPKYKLAPLPDFRSKHEQAMEDRQERKRLQIEMEEKERQQKIIDEFERLPEDEVAGYRRHAWVVVLPPCRGVEAPFYIEPFSGERRDLTHEDYLGVDSVYDHRNYYINMQSLSKMTPENRKSKNLEESSLDKISTTEPGDEKNIEESLSARKSTSKTSQDQLRRDSNKHVSISTEKVEVMVSREAGLEDSLKVDEVEGPQISSESIESVGTREGAKAEGSSESRGSMVEADKFVEIPEPVPEVTSQEDVEEEEHEEPQVPCIEYDLWNIAHWEHLLPGEPFECMAQDETVQKPDKPKTESELAADAAAEKHLDMPNSWVQTLDLDIEEFERRYPGGYKMVHYKKAKLELFAAYQRSDGLVKRVSTYHDYERQNTHMQYDWFLYRADRMLTSTSDFEKDEITETFERGREDFLKKHTYAMHGEPGSLEVRREMEFFSEARPDQLSATTTDATSFQEQFVDREDRLHTRRVTYTARDPEKKDDKFKREILCIVEQYNRNPDVPANDDIATKMFDLEHDYIEMTFHYAYNFVTASTRKYTKPNLVETGGRMIIGPENITGYIASPNAPPPRPLALYTDAEAALESETAAGALARERSAATAAVLAVRAKELQQPAVTVQLFHTNKNQKAQQLLDQLESATLLVSHREREAVADPLAPYLARLGVVDPPSAMVAAQLREQCLNDYMDTHANRETLMQKRIQQINEEYRQKRLAWIKVNQKKLQPEPETVFIEENSHLKYSLHLLEVRLSRHQSLSPLRLRILEEILEHHPMLENYQKSMTPPPTKRAKYHPSLWNTDLTPEAPEFYHDFDLDGSVSLSSQGISVYL